MRNVFPCFQRISNHSWPLSGLTKGKKILNKNSLLRNYGETFPNYTKPDAAKPVMNVVFFLEQTVLFAQKHRCAICLPTEIKSVRVCTFLSIPTVCFNLVMRVFAQYTVEISFHKMNTIDPLANIFLPK